MSIEEVCRKYNTDIVQVSSTDVLFILYYFKESSTEDPGNIKILKLCSSQCFADLDSKLSRFSVELAQLKAFVLVTLVIIPACCLSF